MTDRHWDGHAPDVAGWHNGCRGKQRYTSKKLAAGQVRVLRTKNLARSADRLQAYKCAHCKGWHVGNSSWTT